MNNYYGWISNVSGQLLFNLTHPLNYRIDRIVGDIYHIPIKSISSKDYLVVSMLIDLRDKFVNSDANYTRIFFLAETNITCEDNKNLHGYFYTLVSKENDSIKNSIDKKLLTLVKTLSLDKSKENYENLNKKLDEISILDTTHHTKKITVNIESTGFITLSIDKEEDKLVKQVFIFIKYLFHQHVFHDSSQENISTLFKCKKDCTTETKQQLDKKIIFSIKKHISQVRNKKSHRALDLLNLKGVISYAKSFIAVSNITNKEEELVNLQNIDSSLDNALKKLPYKPSNIYSFLNDFKLVVGIVLLLLAPATLLIKNKAKSAEDITNFIEKTFLPYYFEYIAVTLLLVIIINLFQLGRRNNYITKIILFGKTKIFIYIKKHNKPTLSSFSRLLPQRIIDFEMLIRRSSSMTKATLIVVLFIFFVSLMTYSIYQI